MTNTTAESLHRLVKLALDSGEATCPEEAEHIFSQYCLHIYLGAEWADTLAGEAAFLTALNTASRAFLGGVFVSGDIEQTLHVPLFVGKTISEVVPTLGGQLVAHPPTEVPTIVIGLWDPQRAPSFCIRLLHSGWQAGCAPIQVPTVLTSHRDNPLAGIAAAALAVNEAFLHIRGDLPIAGDREVGISLWNPSAIDDWASEKNQGPNLKYLPAALWLIGLGHLGQAYAWTLGMLPYATDCRPYLVLQDIDTVAESNLSTCILVSNKHIGQRKTRVIAKQLEAVGFKTDIVERRFTDLQRVAPDEPATALFGVDNIVARRAIDTAGFRMVVEAGLGSGHRDFRNIRTHVFPGSRQAVETWSATDAVQEAVELTPVYENLAKVSNNRCGVTQLATRAVATPFVGAMASALVLGDVIRMLHGGQVHSTMDLQLKDVRCRVVVPMTTKKVPPAFVQVKSSSPSV